MKRLVKYWIFFTIGIGGLYGCKSVAQVTNEEDKIIEETINKDFLVFEDDSSLVMKWIPGGTFMMGDQLGEGEKDELPPHQVTVSGFYMSSYEIRVRDYWRYIQESERPWPEGVTQTELDHPITNITWNEAKDFCEWISERTGREYRLPREAEWEYAGRNGGKKIKYPTGMTVSVKNANFWDKDFVTMFDVRMKPVGKYEPNGLGLFDMAGNAAEWCEDAPRPYSQRAQVNPEGKVSSLDLRIYRGGAYGGGEWTQRVCKRNRMREFDRSLYVGFRLVVAGDE